MKKIILALVLLISFSAFAQSKELNQLDEQKNKVLETIVSELKASDVKLANQITTVDNQYTDLFIDLMKEDQLNKALIEQLTKSLEALGVRVSELEKEPVIVVPEPPIVVTPPTDGKLTAFPKAIGAAAYATGGRGGAVLHVTTLDWNDNKGSLKWAMKQTYPRTVVFDVSGEIDASAESQWDYFMSGTKYNDLTIAGQTAPEGGITLKTSVLFIHNIDNVIIRYVRFRRSQSNWFKSSPLWLRGCSNVVLDHITTSHGGDKAFDLSSSDGVSGNITIQNSFFQNSGNGIILGTDTREEKEPLSDAGNFTIANNVYMNISHRTPNPQGNGQYDIINNVVYNWKERLIRITQEGTYNIINNYYKPAKDGLKRNGWYKDAAIGANRLQKLQAQTYHNPLIYTTGNIIVGQRDVPQTDDSDMWVYFAGSGSSFTENQPVASKYFTDKPFDLVGKAFEIQTATQAYNTILNDVGANKTLNADGSITHYQDTSDENGINTIQNDAFVARSDIATAGTFYPEISDIPFPVIPNNTRPASFYISNAHIPEAWFVVHVPTGQDHTDISPNGKPWLDVYLDEIDQ